MIITSIDPGFGGALAQFQYASMLGHLSLLWVVDMPTTETKVGRKKQKHVDLKEARALVLQSSLVAVEAVHAAPGQGVSSMYRFGFYTGALHGLCAGLQIPVDTVPPKTWLANAHCAKSADSVMSRARELFPASEDRLKLKKHKDRAAAILIGYSTACQMARGAGLVVSVR